MGHVTGCHENDRQRMNSVNIAALNRKRKVIRYSSIAVAAVDLAAILMIMMGWQLSGAVIGLAALIGGAVFKRKGKKAFEEECCRLQTLRALGVADGAYMPEEKKTADWLRNTHLVPSSSQLTEPVLWHGVKGQLRGAAVEIAEMTMGCQESNKKQATYSSGVYVRTKMDKPVENPVLLLGKFAFKHAALRAEYEKDGLRLSPVGGKEKGWYALTEGAVSPDAALLEKFDEVCSVAKHRVAMYLAGDELVAFFNGQFYTGEFPLEEDVTEGMFKKHSFAAIVPLMAMAAGEGETVLS